MAINPSPQLALLLSLVHLLAALAVYAAPLPLPVSMAIFLLILVSLSYHIARDALLLLPVSWRHLSIADGAATVITRDGSELTGQVAGGGVVTPFFVILRIRPDGRRGSVAHAIFPDALGEEAFREMCVRLKYA